HCLALQRPTRSGEIDNRKERFMAGKKPNFQGRPRRGAGRRGALKMRDKHGTIKRSTFAACGRFDAMDLMTLTEIRRAAQNGAVPARVHVQVEAAHAKPTRG